MQVNDRDELVADLTEEVPPCTTSFLLQGVFWRKGVLSYRFPQVLTPLNYNFGSTQHP